MEHRVQPSHAPFPHKPLLPPSTARAFSRGAPTEIAVSLCRISIPTYQVQLSQLLSSPELIKPPAGTQALLSPSARSSTYSSQLLGGESCRFTFSLFAAFGTGVTCSHSKRDQLQFLGGLCSEVPCNHETFSQNLKFFHRRFSGPFIQQGEYFLLKMGTNIMSVYISIQHHHNDLGLHKQENRKAEQLQVLVFPSSTLPQTRVKYFVSNQQKGIYQLGGVERTLENCSGAEGL